jgi:protein tyrosine/serine phosphatase
LTHGPDGATVRRAMQRGRMVRFRQTLWRGLLVSAAGVAALVGYLGWLHLSGNYHMVVAGELYRAAQVTPDSIARYQASDKIGSILNLRGASPGAEWYDAEVAASAQLGITHADFAMSASNEITTDEAGQLIDLMRSLPKPLLIHCRHGSDRTGLAAALYLAAVQGVDEEVAEQQLSLRYGHFAVPYLSDAYPMDQTWERMEPILGFKDS